jgi:hypothetical protein
MSKHEDENKDKPNGELCVFLPFKSLDKINTSRLICINREMIGDEARQTLTQS